VHNGDARFALPVPATYVIDATGTVRLAFVDPDYPTRLEPAEIVAALRTLTATASENSSQRRSPMDRVAWQDLVIALGLAVLLAFLWVHCPKCEASS
jgi:hypothetical protein